MLRLDTHFLSLVCAIFKGTINSYIHMVRYCGNKHNKQIFLGSYGDYKFDWKFGNFLNIMVCIHEK